MSARDGGFVDHFRARVLQDALNEALPAYWLKRADTFAAVGNPACNATAETCRRHAEFLTANPVYLTETIADEIRGAA